MPVTQSIPVPSVLISEDGLTVTLKVGDAAAAPTPRKLLAHLSDLGVSVADPRAIEALAGPDGRIAVTEDIVLLRGRRPVPERPGSVELLVPGDDESTASHYDRSAHLSVKPGQAIARIKPVTPGQDGLDVFGVPIPHARVQPPVELGRNVELDADGLTVRATAPGRLCQKPGRLWVETAIEIPGDVDFSCGNLDVASDIIIGGSVLDLFKVKGASIRVAGAIEAAEVNAACDLVVTGGIVGKDKGHCVAGGDITCRYASNSTLVAGGNIRSRGEVAHCRIICRGRLVVEREPLASGHVTANGGVTCWSLGSVTEAGTLIEVGIDEFLRATGPARLAEIRACRAKANHLRSTASQFMRFQKNLTAKQKEQATELLYEATESEAAAAEMLRPLHEALLISRRLCKAELVVEEILHAGVTIRFPTAEATIETDWKGPLRVVATNTDGKPGIVIHHMESDSAHPLVCKAYHDSGYEAFLRAMDN